MCLRVRKSEQGGKPPELKFEANLSQHRRIDL